MHALYLGMRLAWDPAADPKAVDRRAARRSSTARPAKEMAAYWQFIDDVWVKTPEYAGCGFGHLRRWTPEKLARPAGCSTRASRRARPTAEKRPRGAGRRVAGAFEQFMKMRRDLAAGRLRQPRRATRTRTATRMIDLGEQHKHAVRLRPDGRGRARTTVNVRYFDAFYKATYDDAARVAARFDVLTAAAAAGAGSYQADATSKGEAAGLGEGRLRRRGVEDHRRGRGHVVGPGAAQLHGLGLVPDDREPAGSRRRGRRRTCGSAPPTGG